VWVCMCSIAHATVISLSVQLCGHPRSRGQSSDAGRYPSMEWLLLKPCVGPFLLEHTACSQEPAWLVLSGEVGLGCLCLCWPVFPVVFS
jgi:hypothetical protein